MCQKEGSSGPAVDSWFSGSFVQGTSSRTSQISKLSLARGQQWGRDQLRRGSSVLFLAAVLKRSRSFLCQLSERSLPPSLCAYRREPSARFRAGETSRKAR